MKPDDLVDATPAQFELGFERSPAGATILRRQLVAYPFHVGRVLHVPGDPAGFATVYVQSCSGGLFQGERLRLAVVADAGAQVHLTTAASTIVHAMPDGAAEQTLTIEARDGALVEYLPDPLILFPTAQLRATLIIRAAANATVLAAESFLLHDPKGGDGAFDLLGSETRIEDVDGRLLALDRFRIDGRSVLAARPGVNGTFGLQGTLMFVHRSDPAGALEALRSALPESPGVFAGASLLPGDCGAWLRVLASDAIALRAVMRAGWTAARRLVTGSAPGLRRK